ncbi:endolytic transglycosylase MltG [Geomonas sp.]|uniref:endolytic transglycosylase MltG n=1 Tax=Geomonas sp. TaxID=2651584 RepID=UPI002B464B8E|nr:endolytic transglycosylase MltG [Geomonas sp.]HJV36363.1 endolytic transglycosylase MltG [Geomonas sp.]
MTQFTIYPKSSLALQKLSFSHKVIAIIASKIAHYLRKHRTVLLPALFILILIPAGHFYLFLHGATGNGSRVELVELGKGRSLRTLAASLESRRIISSARLFTLYARIRGADSRVKAGVYQFSDGMRPGQILDKMIAGDVYQRLFALPEGYSTYQAAEILEKKGIFKKEEFLGACSDANLLAELKINAKSAEGYLCPGSYNILPGKTPQDVVREMALRQREILESRLKPQSGKGLTAREILTLASMVEKEAVLPAEKPLIAAVFQNRLGKRMRLQSDPTALYGVRAFTGGKVTHEDISRQTPYNTYLIAGLPPGPIGNPGADSIDAVLNHPAVPYLYFVARGDGSHQFSSDLVAHNQAVQKYLKNPGASPGEGR